jgi:hypothetical protein
MATRLTRNISRECLAATDPSNRKLIVTLEAGDMIAFRPKGKRTTYKVPLQAVYFLALISTVNENYKERVAKWKDRKKAGERCRRPRPLPRIFNPTYYAALRLK